MATELRISNPIPPRLRFVARHGEDLLWSARFGTRETHAGEISYTDMTGWVFELTLNPDNANPVTISTVTGEITISVDTIAISIPRSTIESWAKDSGIASLWATDLSGNRMACGIGYLEII